MKMTCMTCAYGVHNFDMHGLLMGVECRRGVIKVIGYDVASVMHCGAWAEVEDE